MSTVTHHQTISSSLDTLVPTYLPPTGTVFLTFDSANVLNAHLFLEDPAHRNEDSHDYTISEAVYTVSTDLRLQHTVVRYGNDEVIGRFDRHQYKRDTVTFPGRNPTPVHDWIRHKASFISLDSDKFPLTFVAGGERFTWEEATDGAIILVKDQLSSPNPPYVARFTGPQHKRNETSRSLSYAHEEPTLELHMDELQRGSDSPIDAQHKIVLSLIEVERVRKRLQIFKQQNNTVFRANLIYDPMGGESVY